MYLPWQLTIRPLIRCVPGELFGLLGLSHNPRPRCFIYLFYYNVSFRTLDVTVMCHHTTSLEEHG